MKVTVNIPTPLRPYTGSQSSVQVSGETVGAALNSLMSAHPGLAKHLRGKDGRLRSFINIYLGDEDIRSLDNEDTELTEGEELTIIPSIAGGFDDLAS